MLFQDRYFTLITEALNRIENILTSKIFKIIIIYTFVHTTRGVYKSSESTVLKYIRKYVCVHSCLLSRYRASSQGMYANEDETI